MPLNPPSLLPTVAAMLVMAVSVSWGKGGGPPLDRAAIEEGRGYVEALASDAMQGRGTPGSGLDSAARWLAATLAGLGVEPLDGSYFHHYRLRRDLLGDSNRLVVDGEAFLLKEDFVPFEFTSSAEVTAPCAYVGFGIARPDLGYDDYEGIDVRGRIVVALDGAPNGFTATGERADLWLDPGPIEKMRMAAEHGAVGFLMVRSSQLRTGRLLTSRPAGFPWPSLFRTMRAEAIPLRIDDGHAPGLIPSVSIGGEILRRLDGREGREILRRAQVTDSLGRPASCLLPSTMTLGVELRPDLHEVMNVAGVIHGSKKPQEFVLASAHYDGLGVVQSLASRGAAEIDTIFNGADDNASGVAGLLIGASRLAALPLEERPERSIAFVFFSGEEHGLLGSRAWTAAPPIPLDRTVALVNLDMIARNSPDTILVGGRSRSRDMSASLGAVVAASGITLVDLPEELFFRSDHAPFAARRIPVIHFTCGLHVDYHRPSDEADRLDFAKLARVARLATDLVTTLASRDERPGYDGAEEDEIYSRMFGH